MKFSLLPERAHFAHVPPKAETLNRGTAISLLPDRAHFAHIPPKGEALNREKAISLLPDRAHFAHIPPKAEKLQRHDDDPPYCRIMRILRTFRQRRNQEAKRSQTSRRDFSAPRRSFGLSLVAIDTVCDSASIDNVLESSTYRLSCFRWLTCLNA